MNNIGKYQKARELHNEAERAVLTHVHNQISRLESLANTVIGKKFGNRYGWKKDPKLTKAVEEALGVWGNIAVYGFEITKMTETHISVSNANLVKVSSRAPRLAQNSSIAIPRVRRGEIEIPVSVLTVNDRQFCAMIRKGVREAKRIVLRHEAQTMSPKIETLQRELRAKQRELDDLLAVKRRAEALYERAAQEEIRKSDDRLRSKSRHP